MITREKKIEYNRTFYLKHRDRIIARQKAYVLEHKEERKVYLLKAKDKISANRKIYRENHKDQRKSYVRRKYAEDIQFRLGTNVRSRINDFLRGRYKAGSAVLDMGCSLEELKTHLEGLFREGMTWKNYGYKGWHIDHMKPLSAFDLSDRKEFLQAVNYKNLQPLWARENFEKSNKP